MYKILCTIVPNDRDLGAAENRNCITKKIESIFKNKDSRIENNGNLEISFEANSLEECEEFLNAICIRKRDGEFEYENQSTTVDKEFYDIKTNFNKQKEEQKVAIFANLLNFYSKKSEILTTVVTNENEDRIHNDLISEENNDNPYQISSIEESDLDDNLNKRESDNIPNLTTKEPSSNTQSKSLSNEIYNEEKDKINDDKKQKNKVNIENLKQNLNLLEKFLALFLRILCKVYIEQKSAEIVEKIKNNKYQESDSKNIFDECMFETTAKLVLESAYQQLTSIKVK